MCGKMNHRVIRQGIRIASAHDSGRGELRDRDVVRVAVSAFGAEGDDYVGPNTSDVPDNCRNGSRGIELGRRLHRGSPG